MHDEPATTTRRGPLLVAVVAAVVLLLLSFAAASPRPVLLETLPRPSTTMEAPSLPAPSLGPVPSVSPMPVPEQDPFEFPGWVDDVLAVVLVAGAAVVVIWFLMRLAAVSRRPQYRSAVADGGQAVEIADLDDEELVEAVEETVASLRRGIAVDDAVIECWRRLEQVAAGTGIPRRPEQTSHEFTADVLSRGSIDAAALADLAELYRAAMFSTHRLTDADRERAIAALERVSAQLRGEASDA